MGEEIDAYIGKRIRRRRLLLGFTQHQVAKQIGVSFQQVHKYECGTNRITAALLYKLAAALDVPTNYVFDGWESGDEPDIETQAHEKAPLSPDILFQRETLDLVRAYYRLDERPRRRLLSLAKAMHERRVAR